MVRIRLPQKSKMADGGHLELLKSLLLGCRLSDFAEILHGDTYEGPQKTTGGKVGTGSRILSPGGVFSIPFWVHVLAADFPISLKFCM